MRNHKYLCHQGSYIIPYHLLQDHPVTSPCFFNEVYLLLTRSPITVEQSLSTVNLGMFNTCQSCLDITLINLAEFFLSLVICRKIIQKMHPIKFAKQ